jgi:hypothetical protein
MGDESLSGVIPAYHRLQASPDSVEIASAFNLRIQDAGLKTQNYDKGFDRFIRKFDPGEEMRATISIFQGQHRDHGWAVYITQQKRRCWLLDTTYGLSDDEALLIVLSAWASFQPRLEKPRVVSDRLFYPDAYSHVFEKYWNYLPCLDQHPDPGSESQYTQLHMKAFSEALSLMSLKGFEVSKDAAISRLLSIQDGLD